MSLMGSPSHHHMAPIHTPMPDMPILTAEPYLERDLWLPVDSKSTAPAATDSMGWQLPLEKDAGRSIW